jgi:hypothetical protein
MNDPITQHTSEILALAMQKHASAIAAVQRRPIDVQAARAAAADLADAEDEGLAASLCQLRIQRAMLERALARFDAHL